PSAAGGARAGAPAATARGAGAVDVWARMSAATTLPPDEVDEVEEAPDKDGVRGKWNDLVKDLDKLNDLKLGDKAEGAIRDAIKSAAKAGGQDEERLKVTKDANGGIKLDWKKLFGEASHFVEQVDATAGIKFEKGDFKAEVQARIEVKDPLTRDASVRVSGFA